MKKISPEDIMFGMNDTSHFVHKASELKLKDEDITLKSFFEKTEDKRRWSIVNPGFILSTAYSYFVYAYEKKLLDNFNPVHLFTNFKVTYPDFDNLTDNEKCHLLKRRLRNAIAHCNYEVEIRTDDGSIRKDGDVWIVFTDSNKLNKDFIKMEISITDFGNLVEATGGYFLSSFQRSALNVK